MIGLMKLEIQKHTIRTFIRSSIIITIIMIGLIFLFAFAPYLEPTDSDMLIFSTYSNTIKLFGAVNMAVFCVFSCVIYSRFIIEAYKGKQLILLFSYPVNHKKILLSKIVTVVIITSLSMLISNVFVFSIFYISEAIHPIVADKFTMHVLVETVKTSLIMVITSTSLSLIATGIGFYTKSVPSTIITGVILSSISCNIAFYSLNEDIIFLLYMFTSLVVSTVTILWLISKVNKLEVL